MRRLSFSILSFLICINALSQSQSEILSELENMYRQYNITGMGITSKLKSVDAHFSAPYLTIHTVCEWESSGWIRRRDTRYKFDVTKAWYDNRYYADRKSLVISCTTGVDEESTLYVYPPANNPFYSPESSSGRKLHDYYGIPINSDVIINRLINAFNNLKALSNEAKVKSTAHLFDNAEISVQNITFITPNNSTKLKANQTGCFKIEIKNTNRSNALNVACVVKEKNKSDLFSYEQYTSVEKINGYETETINIPIKASENVDNGTYPFEVMVTYNGRTIKTQTIDIMASNPKRVQSASSTSSGSGNKTVRMRKMASNTYLISCKVNGLPLDFIFDTGASSVTLSRKQAVFMLKNGYLSKNDIVGSSAYQTASGDIALGTVIRLKKIEINGLILNNVEASIINSDSAPLLLGQSALSRLGKIQIDYKNSTLTIIR